MVNTSSMAKGAKVRQPHKARDHEIELLMRLKQELLRDLRPVDDDGIQPPKLRRMPRKLRDEAVVDVHNGSLGPRDSELIELRIHVVLLMSYQRKMAVTNCFDYLAETYDGLSKFSLKISVERYSTEEEMAYRHFKIKPEFVNQRKRIRYREHVDYLALKGVAFVDPYYPDDWPMDTTEKYAFKCLRVPEHRHWTTYLGKVRSRSGCPDCARLVVSQKMRDIHRAKREAKAASTNE